MRKGSLLTSLAIALLTCVSVMLYTHAGVGTAGVDLGPDHTGQAKPGQNVIYDHVITNTGTATDTFSVDLLSAQGWPVALLSPAHPTETQMLTLEVGAHLSATLQVSLTVPSDARGVTEVTLITATSQLSPTVRDTATDSTFVPAIVHLPLVMRRWPPLPYQPTLYPISNPDGDGSYTVSWTEQPSRLADTYTLEEATNSAFTRQVREVCTTGSQSCNVTGRSGGYHYYRVRGHNTWGYGQYSAVQSATVSPVPSSPHPVETIVAHEADDFIVYNWFSFLPETVDKHQLTRIWITGLHGSMVNDDYGHITEQSRNEAMWRKHLARQQKYVLLVPAIPSSISDDVYAVGFDEDVFLDSTDPFLRRPDTKINLMIDYLSYHLRADGYRISDKVFISGFSAGGMCAQRYTLLHPERVQAMAAGQCGGSMTLPEATYDTTDLDWPLGVDNFETLAGYEFPSNHYRSVPQLIYIGDQDDTNTTVHYGSDIFTNPQITFLNQVFGNTDPTRLQNEVGWLNGLGYNHITFKSYEGLGHVFTEQMMSDTLAFFDANHD